MTYTTATTITGPSLGDPDRIAAWAKAKGCKRPEDVTAYLDTLYRLCRSVGLNAAVLAAQSIHETSESGVPWASYWWTQRLNPAGIGINGDAEQEAASRTFADGAAAARAHALHMALYVLGTGVPTGLSKQDDPRWQAAVDAGRAGIARTIADLTGKWGTDPEYADGVTKWLNALDSAGLLANTVPAIDDTTGDTAVTTFTKHAFPGLPNPVYLPDWLKVTISIIPNGTPGWTSGQKIPARQFTSTTYHDTQNELSSAPSEYRWARDGGRAEINSPGSYNGIFDANGLIITQRFDELVGHAANPTGNVTSYAFEEAYGATGHGKSLEVGLWVHAGVLQAMGKSGGTESMYLHQFWSGKHCAKQVLDRGQWGYAEQTVDAHVAEINASLKQGDGTGGSTTPPPTTTYAKPVPIAELVGFSVDQHDTVSSVVTRDGGDDFIYVGDLVEATQETPRLQYATYETSKDNPAQWVGPKIAAGEQFIVAWLVKAADGEWYYVSPYWTRILRKHTKRIGDVPNLAAGAA